MVQASDLRIGNKITVIGINGIIEVTATKKQPVRDGYYCSIKVGDEKDYRLQEQCFGIRITVEILEKCGFVFTGFTWDTGLHGLSICLPNDMYPNGKTYFNSWTINEGVPDFLHQLQNLYYALTGTELHINL